jgi:hypothetical protein
MLQTILRCSLFRLLTVMSTDLQSFEPSNSRASIQGSKKPGLMKIGCNPFQVAHVQTARFFIPTTFWLSNLAVMLCRVSGTIKDCSLHVSSYSFASRLRVQVMEQAQTETQNRIFHERICFIHPAFVCTVGHLHSGCRKAFIKPQCI